MPLLYCRRDDVPREVVELMLQAANTAPTHGITEPWRFVVLQGQDAISKLGALKLAHAKVSHPTHSSPPAPIHAVARASAPSYVTT